MDFVDLSRDALAETLLAAGPGRPTLCEGWQTQDLAAHLYLREHRPLDAAGIAIPPLHERTERATKELGAEASNREGYAQLIDRFAGNERRRGPRIPKRVQERFKIDQKMNLLEYFVHLEDVRRAAPEWAPRVLDGAYSRALWGELVSGSRLFFRKAPTGVILVDPTGYRHVAKSGRKAGVSVAIVGAPSELIMYAMGRREHALVSFDGADDAIAALTA